MANVEARHWPRFEVSTVYMSALRVYCLKINRIITLLIPFTFSPQFGEHFLITDLS